jgi:hypothetical protein
VKNLQVNIPRVVVDSVYSILPVTYHISESPALGASADNHDRALRSWRARHVLYFFTVRNNVFNGRAMEEEGYGSSDMQDGIK